MNISIFSFSKLSTAMDVQTPTVLTPTSRRPSGVAAQPHASHSSNSSSNTCERGRGRGGKAGKLESLPEACVVGGGRRVAPDSPPAGFLGVPFSVQG